jgi:hypothetical protein
LGLAPEGAADDQQTPRLKRPQAMADIAFVTC